MFLDEISIKLIAGKGGDGCSSFHHEKYVEYGGPDGGNGGKGADIIFECDKNLKTLIDLKHNKIIKGEKGVNGKGSNRQGANAEDIIIKVPEGTTIIDMDTNLVIADLIKDKEQCIICHGGRGGRGNRAFATHDDVAPKISELGEPGEERIVKCVLKVLADVGLVGMPSVGKSTILSLISSASPKIAAYHFTTLNPNLGLVRLKDQRVFVMADLPGLIEGASKGVGLGDRFLKHTERTRIIGHVLDMGSFEGRDPLDDYEKINIELKEYSKSLANKEQLVIANKMDLPNAKDNLKRFKKKYPGVKVVEISTMNNEGLDSMLVTLADMLEVLDKKELYEDEEKESHVIYKFKNEKPYSIVNQNGVWVVSGKEIEKLFKMTRFDNDEAVLRFARKFRGMGIETELFKVGAKIGDEVQILDYIFELKE